MEDFTQFVSIFNGCSCGCVLTASMSGLCLVSVQCSATDFWMLCSRVSLMYSEILVGMRRSVSFDVGLCTFAGQIAATLPINRKAASHIEIRTSA